MKKIVIALSLTALAGSAGAFELQNIGAAALRGAEVRGLPAAEPAVVADRALEDDMIHGAIPSDGGAYAAIPGWANMIYDWEDNRPLVRSGELSGGHYAEKSQAEKAMRDWLDLLRLAGIQPKNYGVSAVTGRPWRFTIFYHASVRLQCSGAGAFKDYAQAVRTVQAAAGKYEAAGKKVVAIMISNSYNSDTPYYTWVYYVDQVRNNKSQVSMPGVDEAELREGWAELKTSYDKSAVPAELGVLAGEYECVLYSPGEEYTEVEKLLVKVFPEGNGATIIFPMPPYGEKARFPLMLGAEGAGFDGNGDGRQDLTLRLNKGGWLNLKTDLYGPNTYGFMRKIWN